ncbi:MAG: DNA polymerase III subunit epsilon [Betaproteobacteria bacterium]|nr:DNA polymerase III subunit epsilon [Betaproteobacteria bacterium]
MRQVVLDTETTGLDFRLGDRVIEVGCVELLNRKPTGQRFHRYINPEREVEAGALAVHGLSSEFLQDKPKFGEIVAEFLEFIQGAELVIHNAGFDVGFLNNELALCREPALDQCCGGVVDTLKLARELHPGRKNSLDALCERYGIDNSGRTQHGALLDAELLAEVYLAMTRGQDSLLIELDAAPVRSVQAGLTGERQAIRVLRAGEDELAEHERVLAEIDKDSRGGCLWKTLASVEFAE